MKEIAILWFRNDLRLSDLPSLKAAAQDYRVLPVFVFDPSEGDEWAIGSASRWWLHHSLRTLQSGVAALGGQLLLRSGSARDILPELVERTSAKAVYCSRQYQPWSDSLERDLKAELDSRDVSFKRFPGTLLFEPGQVVTGAGQPYKVFTPFWRACLRLMPVSSPTAVPDVEWATWTQLGHEQLEDWQLLPRAPNWAEGWDTLWTPGEQGAHEALQRFLAGPVTRYAEGRDIPSESSTSRLSPHLHFGEISPRQVWHAAQSSRGDTDRDNAVDKFLSEIGWREFCHHLMTLFPAMPDRPFNAKFDHFSWQHNPEGLRAWQRGQTGYPLVDAGMRQLWQTGFMHNRVRMVVASFLTKHLLTHWREGERWFWDCLVDADLAANACSWQWVGGSGADAAPYFRIFNPVAQGEKFDPSGNYIRTWVPELAALPNKYLHKPWEAPPLILETAGVKLGQTYPHPIVEHKVAREAALAAYAELKTA